jgi:hypothetical protein
MRPKVFIIFILISIFFILEIKSEESKMFENTNVKELVVDHIMFPVYNNDAFLDEVKEIWETKGVGEIKRDDYEAYSGVFFKTKKFYVEYLSTNKGDGWWRNRICVVVDKQHWDYYKEPFLKDEFFLTPEITSGFFLVSPEYNSTNTKINKDIDYKGFTIYISEALKEKLENICDLKWKLPDYIKTNKNLIHETDIVVVDGKGEYVAPFLQCNTIWIYD